MKQLIIYTIFLFTISSCAQLPEGFVYVKDIMPDLKVELRYHSINNFVGDTIDGYNSNKLILTKQAVYALQEVQKELEGKGLCLKVYDGYRPQQAVDHFSAWAKALNDTINKSEFYPDVKKKDLFKQDYIASRSGHTRGSTVDLTIINDETGEELDMGSPFDLFGEESWLSYKVLTEKQQFNRRLLQGVMNQYGFKGYAKEWWHFTLKDEPFSNTYFDFIIE